MDFGKIGVIMGGPSKEHNISLHSGKAVADALRSKGYDITEIGEKGSIEKGILDSKIDTAFITLHGRYGEDGTIQNFLEQAGVVYTGSPPLASSKAMDKSVSKSIFIENDIPTPDYIVVDIRKDNILEKIKEISLFPVVVKPADEGSSIGLNIVESVKGLFPAVDKAGLYSPKVIIEQYIHGKELTVGILGGAPLPVIHIVPKTRYYNYKAKYTKGMTRYIVPAKLCPDVYRKIQYIGLRAHNALGCRDLSRVDIRLGPAGKPWVLEVNTIPGFTETSLLPKAAEAVGIGFPELCERILVMAWERNVIESLKN